MWDDRFGYRDWGSDDDYLNTGIPSARPSRCTESTSSSSYSLRRSSKGGEPLLAWVPDGRMLACVCFALLAMECEGQVPISLGAITGETSLCCRFVDFGNDNSAPELAACKQACRAFVPYKSLQSCKMNETCTNLVRDFDDAIALATERLSESYVCSTTDRVCFDDVDCSGGQCKKPPNSELAIRRGTCAYHFPNCISDQITISYEVCAAECEAIRSYCNMTLPEVTSVNLCADRDFGCTSRASHRGPCTFNKSLALLLSIVAAAAGMFGRFQS